MKSRSIYIAGVALLLGALMGYFIAKEADTVVEDVPEISNEKDVVWTCSMHPQIRLPDPGLCPICEMDLIPERRGGNMGSMKLEMTPEAIKLANVQTEYVGSHSKIYEAKKMLLTGKIMMDRTRFSTQVAHVPGRLESLSVTYEGQSVRRGDITAYLYSPELIKAQKEYLSALELGDDNDELLKAATQKLKTWKVSDEFISRLGSENKAIENYPVYAENSGVVTRQFVEVGDYLQRGEPLFEINNLNYLWVEFDLYESDLGRVSIGDKMSVEVPAFPGRLFTGTISFIDPVINESTRTTTVRLSVKNSGELKPNMLATGTLTGDDLKDQGPLLIPESSILWTGKRSVVYIRDTTMEVPTFEYREVTLGKRIGAYYEVEEGISSGEVLVVNGSFVLDATAQLNNKSSMINGVVKVKQFGSHKGVDFSDEVNVSVKKELGIMISKYLIIKDALVNSDSILTKATVVDMSSWLDENQFIIENQEAMHYWHLLRDQILMALNEMTQADLTSERMAFKKLSELVIDVVKTFGVDGNPLFVQYCPMANDNNGASWMSLSKEIRNPYFGSKMLKCGKITDTINNE